MSLPPFRAIPPSPAQLAADSEAPAILFFAVSQEAVLAAAATLGFSASWQGAAVRLVASRAELTRLASALQNRAVEAGNHLHRYLAPEPAWQLRTRVLPLDRPHLMGILNLTDDSFSGDGVGHDLTAALRRAEELRGAGASLIDAGAESARADRPILAAEEEARLVASAVTALTHEGHAVSIDTYKPLVARAALESGAEAVNDISGLTLGLGAAMEAASAVAGYVLNYSYSVPKRRPDSPPRYEDVTTETVAWLFERVAELNAAGLSHAQVAVDPGIAFGKSHDEDIQLLRRLSECTSLGLPLLLAHSRKNFIGSVNGQPAHARDLETHAVSALAYAQGARIFRVHDVAGARRALEIAAAITSARPGDFSPGGESWPWSAKAAPSQTPTAAPDKPAPPGQRW